MPIEDFKFATLMVGMGAAVGKAAEPEQIEIYYRLLSDLEPDALEFACNQAVLQSQYPIIPPVGVIRALALEYRKGGPSITAGEAYELARRAIRRFGYMQQIEGLQSLPEDVAAVVRQIGWDVWCDSDNPDAIRARFAQFWDARQARQQKVELLTPPMQQKLEQQRANIAIAQKAAKALTNPVKAITSRPQMPRISHQPKPDEQKPELTPEQIEARERLQRATEINRERVASADQVAP